MTLEIKHLYVSGGHNFYGRYGKEAGTHGIIDCDEIECVAGSGVRGDRFFDYKEDYKGQITFFDDAVFRQVREEFSLPDLPASAFRRNVVTSGLDLNSLIGRRFAIGGVEFEGSEEARPCEWMNEACAPGVHDFLRGHGGLRARILRSGTLARGPASLTTIPSGESPGR